jgi:hypothetical protein
MKGFNEAKLEIMKGTMITSRLEVVPVDLPSIGFAIFTDDRFDVFNVIDATGDLESKLVGVGVATCVRHVGQVKV